MTGQAALTDDGSSGQEEVPCHSTKRRGFFGGATKHSELDSKMERMVTQLVEELTEDEREHAARASYKYLWKSVTTKDTEKQSKDWLEEQSTVAKAMALRFLKSKKGNYSVALQKLRRAIEFRKEMDVDGLRLCFQASKLDLDEATQEKYAMYRERLSERMTTGRVYVCGYDKQGRAIYTIFAARTKDFDPEWFLKESLYNFERALACTERESGGLQESITVIGNYTGFESKHRAPMSISHKFMDSLRQNYPGRVNRVFLLRTPSTFLLFWSLLKPFIGTDTRKKIVFLNESHRQEQFSDLVSVDQATPWMLDGGQKTREFDSKEYLFETPFDEGFDP